MDAIEAPRDPGCLTLLRHYSHYLAFYSRSGESPNLLVYADIRRKHAIPCKGMRKPGMEMPGSWQSKASATGWHTTTKINTASEIQFWLRFRCIDFQDARIPMQKITPFLWFNDNAEEAMNFYVSVFKNSKAVKITRYKDAGPGPKGSVMSAIFELDGQTFYALNGGPHFAFTPAISFFVNCETQEEVDDLWAKLSAGGKEDRCGWLRDKYGLSWQIIPKALGEMLGDKDPEKAKRVMQAMLQMGKIDIEVLKRAYDGK
jgi:predicted 3-demethylubiquinone-9 3-methyltransferase (glyoxalase superfamily)